MNIFIITNGNRQGPLSPAELKQLVTEGAVSLSDKAWHEGCSEWTAIRELPELLETIIPPVQSTPPVIQSNLQQQTPPPIPANPPQPQTNVRFIPRLIGGIAVFSIIESLLIWFLMSEWDHFHTMNSIASNPVMRDMAVSLGRVYGDQPVSVVQWLFSGAGHPLVVLMAIGVLLVEAFLVKELFVRIKTRPSS